MDEFYGTTKGVCWYLGVVGTIEQNDFIQKFNV
jgi:hypothetical protein